MTTTANYFLLVLLIAIPNIHRVGCQFTNFDDFDDWEDTRSDFSDNDNIKVWNLLHPRYVIDQRSLIDPFRGEDMGSWDFIQARDLEHVHAPTPTSVWTMQNEKLSNLVEVCQFVSKHWGQDKLVDLLYSQICDKDGQVKVNENAKSGSVQARSVDLRQVLNDAEITPGNNDGTVIIGRINNAATVPLPRLISRGFMTHSYDDDYYSYMNRRE